MGNFESSFLNKLRYASAKRAGSLDAFHKAIFHDDLPGELASSQHTFIFAGPPLVLHGIENNGENLTPIGLVQDIQYSAQRQIAPIPELGNRFYRHVAGRTNHSATLTRIMSKSANIVGLLYRWLLTQQDVYKLPAVHNQPASDDALETKNAKGDNVPLQAVSIDSDMLDVPFGLYILRTTEWGDIISATYWERCMIVGYSEAISSGQVAIMESLQIVFAKAVPAPISVATIFDGIAFKSAAAQGAQQGVTGSVNNSFDNSLTDPDIVARRGMPYTTSDELNADLRRRNQDPATFDASWDAVLSEGAARDASVAAPPFPGRPDGTFEADFFS